MLLTPQVVWKGIMFCVVRSFHFMKESWPGLAVERITVFHSCRDPINNWKLVHTPEASSTDGGQKLPFIEETRQEMED